MAFKGFVLGGRLLHSFPRPSLYSLSSLPSSARPNSPPFGASFRPINNWSGVRLRSTAVAIENPVEHKIVPLEDRIVTLEDGPNGVAIIRFNDKKSKVNTMGKEFVEQFSQAMDDFEKNKEYKALVLISDKKDFIAGADINQLQACETKDDLYELASEGKRIVEQIEDCSRNVVAAINGQCLGGGLELALACHRRIASTGAVLALPEVLLGLIPGAGGTQRLPDLIGIPQALDMMLTGKSIRHHKAKKLGLVDLVVDPAALESSAVAAASALSRTNYLTSNRVLPPKKLDKMTRLLQLPLIRHQVLMRKAKEAVMEKTRANYPAPLHILDCISLRMNDGIDTAYESESRRFSELGTSPESKALISLFHAKNSCKKNRFGKPKSPARNIGVIGAGLMGAGIAQVSIDRGIDVRLKDRSSKDITRSISQISKNLTKKVKQKRITAFESEQVMSKLHPVTADNEASNEQLKHVDLVIEAVFEDLSLKQNILSELEKIVPEHCVIASNTSQIPISKIASALSRPDKVIGMHYFSPVDKMELLEIITTDKTSLETTQIAVDAGLRQGKSVIVVKDGPGFYTTRILAPMMTEFAALLQAGASPESMEESLKDLGFPVGPVTLIDEVGIDVGSHVSRDLIAAFGQRMEGADAGLLNDMVKAGFLGRKSGKGFYLYGEGKKKSVFKKMFGKKTGRELNPEAMKIISMYRHAGAKEIDTEDMQYRMLTRMVNEALLCLQEGILNSPSDGDFGAVFGLGFPPFLGGPFRWVDTIGAAKVVDMMNKYRDQLGDQFTPCDLLLEHAKTGDKFYPKK